MRVISFSAQSVITRIQPRKQREDESVQSYADEMHTLFAQSDFPEILKEICCSTILKPSLRKQVLNTIPNAIQEVVDNALFLEERAAGVTSERIKGWEQHRKESKLDPVERITRSMDKLSIAVNDNSNREGNMPFGRPNNSDRGTPNRPQLSPPRPPRNPNADPMQCWKCQGYGHRAAECTNPPKAAIYARMKLLECRPCNMYGSMVGQKTAFPQPRKLKYMQLARELHLYRGLSRTGRLSVQTKSKQPGRLVRPAVIQQPMAVELDMQPCQPQVLFTQDTGVQVPSLQTAIHHVSIAAPLHQALLTLWRT